MSSTGNTRITRRNLCARCMAMTAAMAIAVLACFGCSGTPKPLDLNSALGSAASNAQDASSDWKTSVFSPAEMDAQWEAWLADPGVASVDYDPSQIIVGYKRDVKLPSALDVGTQHAGVSAADMPNAIMRHDHNYEQFTDAIAAYSGLPIKHQIYNDHSVWASFRLEDTTSHRRIAEAIRQQFADVVEYVTFSGYGNSGWVPDDPDYDKDLRWELIPGRPGEQWSLRLCDFESAWDETRGDSGVLIAHIDDAFMLTHEELANTYLDPEIAYPDLELDVANSDNRVGPTGLNLPHGTWVGGILAAQGDNNRTIIGAAPGCRVVPFRIAESGTGLQSNADFAAALNLAIDIGVNVVNASWGSTAQFAPQRNACARAYDNGVLVVASVMNDGHDGNNVYYPAAYEFVLGVGGTGDWTSLPEVEANWLPDKRCFFSCYGGHVDIAAPGVHLKTSFYNHSDRLATDHYTDFWAGTSASCPLVAGAAALLWSARPFLSVDEVADALIYTGQPTTGFLGSVVRRLDVGAAMATVLVDPNVSGTVIDHLGGPVEGVSLELSGFGNVMSDVDGYFEFELVPPGSYTLTPTLTDYIFSPEQMQLDVSEMDISGLEFSAIFENLPVAESLSITDGSVRGYVVGDSAELPVFVNWQANGANAVRVVYNLDLAPVGEVNPEDMEVEITNPAAGFLLNLDTSMLHNQQIALTATPYAAGDLQGVGVSLHFWMFNQLGDTDGSGVVNNLDLENYTPAMGLQDGEPGYLVFLDTDLDGVITELDAAAVGYFFTQGT